MGKAVLKVYKKSSYPAPAGYEIKREELVGIIEKSIGDSVPDDLREAILQNSSVTEEISWGLWLAEVDDDAGSRVCGCALAQIADMISIREYPTHPGYGIRDAVGFIERYDSQMIRKFTSNKGVATVVD